MHVWKYTHLYVNKCIHICIYRFDLEADEESEMDPGLLQFLRLKLLEGKDSFILEGCFSDTVFNTLAQPFSKVNEVRYLFIFVSMCIHMCMYVGIHICIYRFVYSRRMFFRHCIQYFSSAV
jgi:hypothetical protein